MSCSELFGRCQLGSTVERLARTLLAAVRLFPGREVILHHAYEMALAGLSNNLEPDRLSRMSQLIEQRDYADFMAATELPAEAVVRPVIEHGALESTLTQYVRSHEIDLVVMGARGRSAVMTVLLGSS